ARSVDALRSMRHRELQKLHQPVQSQMIWRDLRRPSSWFAGLRSELVFPPLGQWGSYELIRSLNHDLIALPADASKCAIGIHQMEAVVAIVHELISGDEIQQWLDTKQNRQAAKYVQQCVDQKRTWRCAWDRHRYDSQQCRVTECAYS